MAGRWSRSLRRSRSPSKRRLRSRPAGPDVRSRLDVVPRPGNHGRGRRRSGRLDAAVLAVGSELDDIDRTCSRFRTDSDVSRVNDAGGHGRRSTGSSWRPSRSRSAPPRSPEVWSIQPSARRCSGSATTETSPRSLQTVPRFPPRRRGWSHPRGASSRSATTGRRSGRRAASGWTSVRPRRRLPPTAPPHAPPTSSGAACS